MKSARPRWHVKEADLRKLVQIALAFGPTLVVIFLINSLSHQIGAFAARQLLTVVGENLVPATIAMIFAITISLFGLAFVMIQRWLLPTTPEKKKVKIRRWH